MLVFGLITLLQVLSDSFDGTENTFEAVWERLNLSFLTDSLEISFFLWQLRYP